MGFPFEKLSHRRSVRRVLRYFIIVNKL